MITTEMRNMMLREQLLNDIAKIKEEMVAIKIEIDQLKKVLRERNRL